MIPIKLITKKEAIEKGLAEERQNFEGGAFAGIIGCIGKGNEIIETHHIDPKGKKTILWQNKKEMTKLNKLNQEAKNGKISRP